MVNGLVANAVIAGATRAPLPYGLFSTFAMRPDSSSDRWRLGATWEQITCDGAAGIGAVSCLPDGTQPPAGATPYSSWMDGDRADVDPCVNGVATPLTVYGYSAGSPFGGMDHAERAMQHLVNREEARVEQALQRGDLGNKPYLNDPDYLERVGASGTTYSVTDGIALLEQYLATAYGSVGVIHMTRAAATAGLAQHALVVSGQRLSTKLGTPVAAGAGYDPAHAPAGFTVTGTQQVLYATPALFGYRGEAHLESSDTMPVFERGTNTQTAIVLRDYLLGFDTCGVGAVLTDLTT